MIISSQNNLFVFQFPIDFLEDYLYDLFQDVLDKNFMPYDNALDFLNSTIKEINFPGLTYQMAEQVKWKSKRVEWKPTQNVFDTFNRDLSITFRSVESHANYFMMVQIMTEFYLNNDKHYLPILTLHILDKTGDLIYTVLFKDVLLKGLSDIKLSYASYDVQEKTFTLEMRYVWMDILWETKRHPLANDKSIFQLPKYECEEKQFPSRFSSKVSLST